MTETEREKERKNYKIGGWDRERVTRAEYGKFHYSVDLNDPLQLVFSVVKVPPKSTGSGGLIHTQAR